MRMYLLKSKLYNLFIQILITQQTKEKIKMVQLISIPNDNYSPIQENPTVVYLTSLSKGSRRTMQQSLQIIAQLNHVDNAFDMPWELLRYQHTQAIRTKLSEMYAPSTVNKMLSALKGVLKECWKLGKISAEEYHRSIDLKQLRHERLPSGRFVYEQEVNKLFLACKDNTVIGCRDLAILVTMFGSGLRRSEIVKLSFFDYLPKESSLKIISGKGNKDRISYIPVKAKEALEAWLQIRGNSAGALFCRIKKGNILEQNKNMSTQAIYFILQKRAEQAGIQNISPHDSRRTYITTLLDNDVDISTVQKLVGHANVNTTLRYDRREEDVKKKAVEKLNLPF